MVAIWHVDAGLADLISGSKTEVWVVDVEVFASLWCSEVAYILETDTYSIRRTSLAAITNPELENVGAHGLDDGLAEAVSKSESGPICIGWLTALLGLDAHYGQVGRFAVEPGVYRLADHKIGNLPDIGAHVEGKRSCMV